MSLATSPLEAQTTPAQAAETHVWLDSTGKPVPFQTHGEILDYLRSAEVVERSPIGRGVSGAERLLMHHEGLRVRAAFRIVDESYRGPFENLPMSVRRVRDSAVFECAAYELGQALGFGRVPPTVCRRVGDKDGSVQMWVEGAMPLDDFMKQFPESPHIAGLSLQEHGVYVFDALIANLDRNQGNVLVDREGTLWAIDHTRAFASARELLAPEKVTRCSRDLWSALRNLDEDAVKKRLEPFLNRAEMRALFKRHEELVKHIEELIAEQGEEAVLFDIDPPPAP